MFEKLIGLSFISAAADILLSGSSFKKYIKAVIGAVFVLTVISGVLRIENFKINIPDSEEFYENVYEHQEVYNEELRKEVVLNTEKTIKEKLASKDIEVTDMIIDFEEDFIIKKIRISLENYSKYHEKTIELLVNYFGMDKEVIELCQG